MKQTRKQAHANKITHRTPEGQFKAAPHAKKPAGKIAPRDPNPKEK